jgi:hypothetical protein
MAFLSVGTNLSRLYLDNLCQLSEDLETLRAPDRISLRSGPIILESFSAAASMRSG